MGYFLNLKVKIIKGFLNYRKYIFRSTANSTFALHVHNQEETQNPTTRGQK